MSHSIATTWNAGERGSSAAIFFGGFELSLTTGPYRQPLYRANIRPADAENTAAAATTTMIDGAAAYRARYYNWRFIRRSHNIIVLDQQLDAGFNAVNRIFNSFPIRSY